MKKTFILILFFVCSCFMAFAEEIFFRGLEMGFSPEEIIQKDGEPNNRWTNANINLLGDLLFIYKDIVVAGHPASMEIEFENNKAIAASYNFKIQEKKLYDNVPDPIEASLIFNDIKNKMNKLYGCPSKDSEFEPITDKISAFLAQTINNNEYTVCWFDFKIMLLANVNEKNNWEVEMIYLSEKTYQDLLTAQKEQSKKEASTDGL